MEASDGTPSAFRSRVDETFAKLDSKSTDAAPSWSLTQKQVFRPGKEEAYSSDEDRDASMQEQARQEILPAGLLDFEGIHETGSAPMRNLWAALANRYSHVLLSGLCVGLESCWFRRRGGF